MKPCQNQHHARHETSHSTISRRKFIEGAGITAAGLFLASCQSPASIGSQPTGKNPVVAIAKAATYDRALIKKQIQATLDGIGGISDVLAHGTRVAIKVNLTGGVTSKPLPGTTEIETYITHPEVVRAVIELLRDAGAKDIFIVEAAYEPESWPHYGLTDVAKDTGATIVDLTDFAPYKDFTEMKSGSNPLVYDKFKVNPLLTELDAFVSISKMKCHSTAGVTHSMKNLFGLVPYRFYTLNSHDTYRSAFHGQPTETRERVPGTITDLNIARPVNLSIIDGVMSSEGGEGPWVQWFGPRNPGLLMAGKDPVATDAVATAAMGFDPTADYPDKPFLHGVNHLNLAAKAGLGTNRLDEIKVVGEALKNVTIEFKPSF